MRWAKFIASCEGFFTSTPLQGERLVEYLPPEGNQARNRGGWPIGALARRIDFSDLSAVADGDAKISRRRRKNNAGERNRLGECQAAKPHWL
jgi:hypothetical protein